jgi:cation-transporting P-type ATPase E
VQIARANVFTLFNNVLFGIGLALLALGRVSDAVVSAGLGLLNALISAVQEMRSKRALDRLKRDHGGRANVVREGTLVQVEPRDLVVGDLVRLYSGEQVLLSGPVEGPGMLEVVESSEEDDPPREPITKVAGEWLVPGSIVVAGQADQRVHAEGSDGAHDADASTPTWQPSQTPLQHQIDQVIRAVVLVAIMMGTAILAQALMEGLPLVRVVQISAVLTGLVPYGLFLLVTLSYSVGAAAIARRGVLVQQVNAVESLSNVDALCCEATGTLTTGERRLERVHVLHPALSEEQVTSLLGTLAASSSSADPATSALREGLPGAALPVREEVGYFVARGWGGVAMTGPASDDNQILVLGGMDALAPALVGSDPASTSADLDAVARTYTRDGLRVLLLARAADPAATLRDEAGHACLPALLPLAVVVLSETLRPGAVEALSEMQARGVRVVLLSQEDRYNTSAAATQLGLSANDGAEAGGCMRYELTQRHKDRAVADLVGAGRYVAMMGNGAADTAALQRAHVGIATRSGSDSARDAADIILLGDSFTALPDAHREGQRIIGAIAPVMMLFLSRVAISMGVIIGVSILGLGFPYEPAQGSLTLFTVGLPTLFLTAWARPARPDPHLIARLVRFVLPAAAITGAFAIAIYAALFTLLSQGLAEGMLPVEAFEKFETFTGLARDDPDFVETAATAVAQMGLSLFSCLSAFLLILFIEPPTRLFAGWAPVSSDKRPAPLVVGLLVAVFAVVQIPTLGGYFGLVQPGGFEAPLVLVTTVVWFFVMRAVWRHDIFRRALRLPELPSLRALEPSQQLTP